MGKSRSRINAASRNRTVAYEEEFPITLVFLIRQWLLTQIQITCFSESGQNYGMNSTIFTRRFLRKAFISYFNSQNLFPKYNINLILGNRFVIIVPQIQFPSKVNQGNAD